MSVLARLLQSMLPGPRDRRSEPRFDAEALLAQAVESLRALRHDEAHALCCTIIEHEPTHARAHHLDAAALAQRGELPLARQRLDRALALDPQCADAWADLGNVLRLSGADKEALVCYERAGALVPQHSLAALGAAQLLSQAQRKSEAIAKLTACIAPDYDPLLLRPLVTWLCEEGRADEARALCVTALDIHPGHAEAHHCAGYLALTTEHDPVTALAHLDRAAAVLSSDADLHSNRGIALQDLGRVAEAIASYDRALAIDPGHRSALIHRGLALLLRGDYGRGWIEYEKRRLADDWGMPPEPVPEWQGEDLRGKSIYVYAEQGIGDEILFASCVPDLVARAKRVFIETDARLMPLLRRSFPGILVFSRADRLTSKHSPSQVGADCMVPIASLPRYFRPNASAFPAHAGYLRADDALGAEIRARLALLPQKLKVGISWRGGTEKTRARKRSIDLAALLPVLRTPGIDWVCVQYGDMREELTDLRARHGIVVHDYAEWMADFDRTAALVDSLDLVISVQTAVVHVAGALGRPVWVALPFVADWRYGLRGPSMPWYPSARLLWQQAPGDWEQVVGEIASMLQARVRNEPLPQYSPADRTPSALPDIPSSSENLQSSLARAAAMMQAGNADECFAIANGVVVAAPNFIEAHLIRAQAALALERLDDAAESYAHAHRLRPDVAEIAVKLGTVHEARRAWREAEHSYRRAIDVQPGVFAAHLNLGNVLRESGDLEGAAREYGIAIELQPCSAKARGNLANLHKLRGALGPAEQHFRAACALDPADTRWRFGLGATLHDMGRLDEAIGLYEAVLAESPGDEKARLNLAYACLGRGDFARGWDGIEVRYDISERPVRRHACRAPTWQGEALGDAALLVWGEQGIADEILYAAMYPDLVGRANRIVLECQPKLRALFTRSFPWAEVVGKVEPADERCVEGLDRQIAAASLGAILRPGLDSFPARTSHLVADPVRVERWRARLAALGPGPKVGFSWRSSKSKTGERSLSCSRIEEWASLFQTRGVHWVCLQYDDCADELDAVRRRFDVALHRFEDVDFFNDLDEVAALNAALDWVISRRSAVSALSAALGVETWEFGFGADWQTHGTDRNPWLPAVMRVERPWDCTWSAVFDRLAERIHSKLA